MKKDRSLLYGGVLLAIAVVSVAAAAIFGGGDLTNTAWSLVPPFVAIALALITKEVYSSLFIGILVGAVYASGFSFEGTVNTVLSGGIISVLSDAYNVGILVFLVVLGAIVALMNKAGGSAAFGRWAAKNIKSRVLAQLATMFLGVLIFIDDYFNCLTVGSVMRPVTDTHKVSRAKLAYLIDATAAPVCIIAPISSWAAAVSGFVEGENGLKLFISAIPYNFYALLTIIMMITIILLKFDFGPMAVNEKNAQNGDLFTVKDQNVEEDDADVNPNGKVIDLVFPIISLIICCVLGMIYSGGFFSGTSFADAFAGCDASVGLAIGSLFGLLITIVFYLFRGVLTMTEMMECIPSGFKAMVPAILILTFAWTLKAMTDALGAKVFVSELIHGSAQGLLNFLPCIIFLIACVLAFASGTSWGTFGILIPIVVDAFAAQDRTLMIIAISACMAGAVCGDHCSPISDTTIMASAGARCNHVNHVSTQLPYAIFVAGVSAVTYLVAGFTRSAWVSLPVGIIITVGVLAILKYFGKTTVNAE